MLTQSVVKHLDKKLFTQYSNYKEFFDNHEFYYTDKNAESADLLEYNTLKYELGYPFEIEYVDIFSHHIEHTLYKMLLQGYFKENFLDSTSDGFLFVYKELELNIVAQQSLSEPMTFKFKTFP